MRVNKAKRRWLRWQRYVIVTRTRSNHGLMGGMHKGFVNAHADACNAHRYAPIGIRWVGVLPPLREW